jgi:hypothetical protein
VSDLRAWWIFVQPRNRQATTPVGPTRILPPSRRTPLARVQLELRQQQKLEEIGCAPHSERVADCRGPVTRLRDSDLYS